VVATNAMEKPKKTKSRSGCKMSVVAYRNSDTKTDFLGAKPND
jgi:hypothetical protein